MRPGETIELEIGDLGAGGDGIARLDDGPVYVPYAAPGDRVRVAPERASGQNRRGRIVEILEQGPDRVAPECPHFGRCGGCATQHLGDSANRHWKEGMVRQALRARGLDEGAVAPILTLPPATRRRATVAVHRGRDGLTVGFQMRRSRRIVDIQDCRVLRPQLLAAIGMLRDGVAGLLRRNATVDVYLCESDTGLDVWIQGDGQLDLEARTALAALAEGVDIARISWGPAPAEQIVVRREPMVRLSGIEVSIPPGAFLQASSVGEALLVERVSAAVGEASRVVDLFAGCGTFALALARRARVTAYDAAADHVEALRRAVNRQVERRVETGVRDLYQRPLGVPELRAFDAAVFDPPRAGARAQAEALAQSALPVVVAVSCNPGTFARDARILVDGGYRLDWVAPVDQFLWAAHVELVARFKR